MGRKPVGDKPLTPAEKMRRYRANKEEAGYTRKEKWVYDWMEPPKEITEIDIAYERIIDFCYSMKSTKKGINLWAFYELLYLKAKEMQRDMPDKYDNPPQRKADRAEAIKRNKSRG